MPRTPLVSLSVALVLLWSSPASAYDPRHTHRWLTRQAVEHLVRAYPGQYDELLEYVDAVAEGALHEDDPLLDGDDDPRTMRVMRHFFHGADGRGLSYDGRPFPNSYEWALEPDNDNEWNWAAGLEAYRQGDLEQAYFILGHVVHLIQDLTVPAHSHLDPHGPPYGDTYEDYCSSQMISQYESRLPVPPPNAPVPEFADAYEAWWATAQASYWRNMYPGDLSSTDAAAGVIAQMFPELSWSWLSETWTISSPPVGKLDADFWEEQPGWFYFENAAHPAEIDYLDYHPYAPADSTLGPNAGRRAMVEGFASDLIPVAILHSAAVMKLFLDEAYALEPDPTSEPDQPPGPGDAAGCSAGGAAPLEVGSILFLLALYIRRKSCAD